MTSRSLRDIAPAEGYAPFVRAFDAAAPTYDADYGAGNAIMQAFRLRSLHILDAVLPRQGALLELGCGTGVEAAALARSAAGRLVLATDLSQEMLKQARQRALDEGVSNILFLQMAAGDVQQLRQRFPPLPSFLGAYSSFGALNCEPDVRRVAAGLATLLPSGAPFVVSVMNQYCFWEPAWYAAHGDLRRAARRVRPSPPPLPPPLPHTGSGRGLGDLPVTYFTPRTLAAAFAPWFAVERQEGMGVALPPPSLAPWLARRPRLSRLLMAAEERLRGTSAAAWLGDHVLMVLRRTDADAEAP